MKVEEINKYIIEEMGLAEEQGDNVTIRLNLSDESSIKIWFDEENDYYTWSEASYERHTILKLNVEKMVENITNWPIIHMGSFVKLVATLQKNS